MEDIRDLLEQIREIVEDDRTVDDETKQDAIDLVKRARTAILIATDSGVGYVGSATKIIATWATMTLELLNKVDTDGEMIKRAFELAYSLKDKSEIEQMEALRDAAIKASQETTNKINKMTLDEEKANLKERLKEIDKELKQLKEDE